MKKNDTQADANGTPKKRGRLSKAAQFLQSGVQASPIKTLPYAKRDDPNWFQDAQSYIIRCWRLGAEPGSVQIDPQMLAHMQRRVTELIDSPARRFFIPQVNSQAWIPDLGLKGAPRKRAIELSHELLRVTKSDPKLTRLVALGFCKTASARMRILLTDHADAALGQSLIQLVEQLGLEWLGFIIVGFRNGDREEDLSDWLVPLGLRPDEVVIEREQVHNPDCEAALKYIAVDVVNLDIRRASREFLEVMLVASIVELWNCVSLP
jgi:hypothetical protein